MWLSRQYFAVSTGSSNACACTFFAAAASFAGSTPPRKARVRWILSTGVARPSSPFAHSWSASAVSRGGQRAKNRRIAVSPKQPGNRADKADRAREQSHLHPRERPPCVPQPRLGLGRLALQARFVLEVLLKQGGLREKLVPLRRVLLLRDRAE